MQTSTIVFDGLWQCLCPSFISRSVALISRLPRPKPLAPQACARTLRPPATCGAQPARRPCRHYSTAGSLPRSRLHEPKPKLRRASEERWPPTRPGPGGSPLVPLQDLDTATIYDSLQWHAARGHAQTKELVEYLVRERNERPNARLYSALILANVNPMEGSAAAVGALLSELRAEGLEPDAGVCHDALRALAVHPDYLLRSEILDFMRQRWFTLSATGQHDVVAGLLRERQYEMALDRLDLMHREGIPIQPWLYDMTLYLLAESEEIDEALRIMQQRTAAGESNISASLWYHLLDKASSVFHYDATSYVWKKRVETSYLNPSSGTCLNVLFTAARAGDAQLATDVFRILGNRSTVFEHAHYEALLETYISASDLRSALSVLSIMAAADVAPDEGSTRPIFRFLSTRPDDVSAAFEILSQLHDADRPIPPAAVNALLEASVHHGDIAQALETYKALHAICPSGTTTATFNILLKGCNAARRKDLAMFLAAEMNALHVRPDALTYDRLLLTCLSETDYEDALLYYAEMGAMGWVPRQGTYNAVVRKCCEAGDARAWSVLRDMREKRVPMDRIQAWLEANWKGGRVGEEGVGGYGGPRGVAVA